MYNKEETYFTLTNEEKKDADNWINNHKCKFNEKEISRMISYCFTPLGMGTGIEIKCSCGKSIDVTDVSVW